MHARVPGVIFDPLCAGRELWSAVGESSAHYQLGPQCVLKFRKQKSRDASANSMMAFLGQSQEDETVAREVRERHQKLGSGWRRLQPPRGGGMRFGDGLPVSCLW